MQDAATFDPQDPASEAADRNLFLSNDTLLGVCEGLGQDFGFNPIYLRVALASLVLWNSVMAIGIYLALGLAVALSRWIYPAARPETAPQAAVAREAAEPANSADTELLAA